MLTLTGIAVGLAIRFSPGHAGPDPALEPLIGAPVPLCTAGADRRVDRGPAGGVSLGPEHPIMAVNIGRRCSSAHAFCLASARWTGPSSPPQAPSGRFWHACRCCLIFSQTLASDNDVPLWDKLFAPLMAAAAGALTTSLFFHPHFSSLCRTTEMRIADIFSGAIVVAIAIALGMVAVWCLPRLHRLVHKLKHPVLILGTGVNPRCFRGNWRNGDPVQRSGRDAAAGLQRCLACPITCCLPSSSWRRLSLLQRAVSAAGVSSRRCLSAWRWG